MEEKNLTRVGSLLGTWTAQTEMKASFGDYKLVAYFTVHFMPNPMRQYGCELKGCKEMDNRVCMRHIDRNAETQECTDMEGNVVDWSDVSAFMSFGAKVDAGFPFGIHKSHDSGGWVGPFSVILAQNDTKDEDDVVDRYTVRYVESPTTPYLRMEPNCTLFSPSDFERYMGLEAVRETLKVQSNASSADTDPFGPQLKNCDNGDVRPILPLFEFAFVENDKGEEQVQVRFKYKVLTIPHKSDIMYKVYPNLQKRMNTGSSGFHISGPYCYGDDPKRGWTFDFNYDSRHEDSLLRLDHGCMEGLPCLPSASQISPSALDVIHNTTQSKVHTLSVGPILLLSAMVVFLSIALFVSLAFNCCAVGVRRLMRSARLSMSEPGPPPETEVTAEMQVEPMQQPLLEDEAEENVVETENTKEATAEQSQVV